MIWNSIKVIQIFSGLSNILGHTESAASDTTPDGNGSQYGDIEALKSSCSREIAAITPLIPNLYPLINLVSIHANVNNKSEDKSGHEIKSHRCQHLMSSKLTRIDCSRRTYNFILPARAAWRTHIHQMKPQMEIYHMEIYQRGSAREQDTAHCDQARHRRQSLRGASKILSLRLVIYSYI